MTDLERMELALRRLAARDFPEDLAGLLWALIDELTEMNTQGGDSQQSLESYREAGG